MAERFQHRYTVCLTVLGAMNWPGNAPMPGHAIDSSEGGFRIAMERDILKRGSLIQLMVPIAINNIQVPVLAEVRWMREESSGGCQAGVRFIIQ